MYNVYETYKTYDTYHTLTRTAVSDAIDSGTDLVILYTTDKEVLMRRITPIEHNRESFKAFCHTRGNYRTFNYVKVSQLLKLPKFEDVEILPSLAEQAAVAYAETLGLQNLEFSGEYNDGRIVFTLGEDKLVTFYPHGLKDDGTVNNWEILIK